MTRSGLDRCSILPPLRRPETTEGPGSDIVFFTIAWFAMLVGGFLVFIVRPQRRKMQEYQAMQDRLAVGDEVITTSGMFGRIVEIDDDEVRLEVAPNLTLRFARAAIGRPVDDADAGSVAEEQSA